MNLFRLLPRRKLSLVWQGLFRTERTGRTPKRFSQGAGEPRQRATVRHNGGVQAPFLLDGCRFLFLADLSASRAADASTGGGGGNETGRKPPGTTEFAADCDSLRSFDTRAGDGARTHDSHVGNVAVVGTSINPIETCADTPSDVVLSVAQLPADPDLALVVQSWAGLPPHIRAAVLALVTCATG